MKIAATLLAYCCLAALSSPAQGEDWKQVGRTLLEQCEEIDENASSLVFGYAAMEDRQTAVKWLRRCEAERLESVLGALASTEVRLHHDPLWWLELPEARPIRDKLTRDIARAYINIGDLKNAKRLAGQIVDPKRRYHLWLFSAEDAARSNDRAGVRAALNQLGDDISKSEVQRIYEILLNRSSVNSLVSDAVDSIPAGYFIGLDLLFESKMGIYRSREAAREKALNSKSSWRTMRVWRDFVLLAFTEHRNADTRFGIEKAIAAYSASESVASNFGDLMSVSYLALCTDNQDLGRRGMKVYKQRMQPEKQADKTPHRLSLYILSLAHLGDDEEAIRLMDRDLGDRAITWSGFGEVVAQRNDISSLPALLQQIKNPIGRAQIAATIVETLARQCKEVTPCRGK